MSKAPTIVDVAQRAGVSVATVSRALRGLPHVSASTRAKVEASAEALDYQPNPHASRLAAGRSGTVGIVLPRVNSWYYGSILAGVQSALRDDQLDLHLITVNSVDGMERFFAGIPSLTKQVDGLVLIDIFLPLEQWDTLAVERLPIATIGLSTGLFDAVMIDNLAAARAVGEHLVGLGHEDIAFVTGGLGAFDYESARIRGVGLAEAVERSGGDPSGIVIRDGAFTFDGGAAVTSELIQMGRRPTAIFCASDEMAIGAIAAIRQGGLRLPADVAVVGFDDHAASRALGLTTVHQPIGEMAARAVDLVLSRNDEPDRPSRREYFDAPLIIRGSTEVT